MNKPTIEATNVVMQAIALIQADANGQYIPAVENAFGEKMDEKAQVEQAKASIARFASAYCK